MEQPEIDEDLKALREPEHGRPLHIIAHEATDDSYFLGEGPVWDPVHGRLLWVDIRAGVVLSGALRADGRIDVLDSVAFGGTVGAVSVSRNGEWLVAVGEQLLVRLSDGTLLPGPRILPAESGRRLNDGKADPAGRFVVGSLHLNDDTSISETLSVVGRDGSVRILDDDLTLSNGLGWSIDGSRMYSVDTLRKRISVREYDPETGGTGARSIFVELDEGYPDGLTLDADDHVWVAVWGVGEVHRYSPAGELVAVVEVPAPHTSSVAFAGPLLETLVITTAIQDLDHDRIARFPGSGRVFTAAPGPLGAPQPLWGGFTRSIPPTEP